MYCKLSSIILVDILFAATIWPRALEHRAKAHLRNCVCRYGPIIIRAVDRAGLLSIRAQEHMRVASRALWWIRTCCKSMALLKIKLIWPDARRIARSQDLQKFIMNGRWLSIFTRGVGMS
jgi:hypothetical protein